MKEVTPDKSNDDKEDAVTDKAGATAAVEKDGDTSTTAADTTAVENTAVEAPAVESTAVEAPAIEATQPVALDNGGPSVKKRSWLKWAAASVVGALLIATTALAVIFGWKLHNRVELSDAASQAESAARAYAVVISSTDSKNLDKDIKNTLDGSTGEFKETYQQSAEQLKKILADNDANGKGSVVASGIKTASTDKVDVLLFVDQSVTNKASPQPRTDRSRLVMTMEKVDGRWLASKVDPS